MKISFTPAINNTKAVNKSLNKQKVTNPNNNNVKEMPKGSVAELLGRSQTVSFGAKNVFNGNFLEHSCVEKQGLNKLVKDQILFDRTTGNMTHIITDKDDNLISRDEYYPKKGSQIRTTLDENGISTITTITPKTKTVEKLDEDNRTILVAHTDEEGNRRIETTNYKRHRMVVREVIKGVEQQTKVYDIDTGKEVTSGPMVIDRKYDQATGTYTTQNIITKDVLRKEQYSPRGVLLSQTTYFPQTGTVRIQKEYNAETDSYETSTYSREEGNPLVTFENETRNGKEKQVITYEADGKTIHSNILYIKKKHSDEIGSEIKYRDNSKIIEQKIVYGKANERTEYYYADEPNVPRCALAYGQNGSRLSETYFAKDGKTPALRNSFKEDGSIIQTQYSKEGKKSQIRHYTAQKQIKYVEELDTKTQALKFSVAFNLENGNKTITSYDEDYELPYKQTVKNKNGVVLKQTIFHANGETPQYTKRYRNDRSYMITEYDEKGVKIKSEDFNADGTKRTK